jgi:hypothetical protein
MQKHFMKSLFVLVFSVMASSAPVKAQDNTIGADVTLENFLKRFPDQLIAKTKNGDRIWIMGGLITPPAMDEKFCGIGQGAGPGDDGGPGNDYVWAVFRNKETEKLWRVYTQKDVTAARHPDAAYALQALQDTISNLQKNPEGISKIPLSEKVKCGTPMTFQILPTLGAG